MPMYHAKMHEYAERKCVPFERHIFFEPNIEGAHAQPPQKLRAHEGAAEQQRLPDTADRSLNFRFHGLLAHHHRIHDGAAAAERGRFPIAAEQAFEISLRFVQSADKVFVSTLERLSAHELRW